MVLYPGPILYICEGIDEKIELSLDILDCHLWFNSLRPSDAYIRQSSNHHWSRWWLVAWPAPSHYLNQCWDIINWALRNKLQWNFNRYWYIFIQESSFENVICEMASILSRPQCVKLLLCIDAGINVYDHNQYIIDIQNYLSNWQRWVLT